MVDVLGNDTDPQGNNTLDPTSVKLLDPAGNPVTSLVVPNEGTWSVDPASGEVTFTPEAGFTGNPSSVQYTVADKDKNVSAPASITVTYSTSPQVGGVSSPSVTEGEALVYEVSMDAPAQATVVELQLVRGAGVEDSDLGAVEVSTDGGNTWTVVQPDAQGKFTATVPANSDKGVQVRVATVDDSAVEQGEELTLNAGVAGQAPLSGVGSIADNDAATPPLAPPQAEKDPANQGGVIITPRADADKLTISYTDEQGQPQTIEVVKDPATGTWSATNPLPQDVGSVDPQTGAVTLTPGAVADDSDVIATNSRGAETSPEATVRTDVDASPQVGSVSSPSVTEGEALVYEVS
ncbi:MAG: hypothetical protein Q4D61_02545, partial [Cardiobacteriaceae bacterium]|nr:hypothetical protein [Cardiobacteriaceae bacterium]